MPHHPIQRLLLSAPTSHLYTATSNILHAFESSTGELLGSWTAPTRTESTANSTVSTSAQAEDGSTTKKRKLEKNGNTPHISSGNPITRLLGTRDGKYVLTATAEDKTVRVFSTPLAANENLKEISARALPKRIVDLALVEQDSIILCADKFGDVWALPLIDTNPAREAEEAAQEDRRKRTEIDYALPFTHKLLLGHVSMLIALEAVTLPAEAGVRERTYVITGDRDEHIRVTRYPQTYVIHGFCLAHTQFVSVLLVPSWNHARLISGGGDTYLLVWDWRESRFVQKLELSEIIANIREASVSVNGKLAENTKGIVEALEDGAAGAETDTGRNRGEEGENETAAPEEFKISVTKICEVPALSGILVNVEAVPALLFFKENSDGKWDHKSTIHLPGNVLDMAVDAYDSTLFITMDLQEGPKVQTYVISEAGKWILSAGQNVAEKVSKVAGLLDIEEKEFEKVRSDLLYPIGSVRKGFRGRVEEED